MENKTERIDIRIPKILLKEIETYQGSEDISNRTTAILELIRKGLKNNIIADVPKIKGDSQRIDMRIPVRLIEKIETYQKKNNIRTRAGALKHLVTAGLMVNTIKLKKEA